MNPLGLLLSASPAPTGGGGITVEAVVGIQLVVVAVLLAAFSRYVRDRRPRWAWRAQLAAIGAGAPGLVLVVAGVLSLTGGSSVGAVTNPIPDTVSSVDRGGVVYQATCARCHGVDALGSGVDAGSTQVRPPNLRSGHLNQHTDSDIYKWISDGLPRGMPAWAGPLSEADRWNLVNYLRSINGHPPSASASADGGAPSSGASPASAPVGGPVGPSTPARAEPPEAAGLAVAGGFGSVLLGWLAFGFGRLGRSRRRSGSRAPDDR
jgi:mono/diheme cytochrome c family protein